MKAKNPIITFVYPSDPQGSRVGGIVTIINGFIKYAPKDFQIEYVGITSSPQLRPVGSWLSLQIGQRKFRFYPLMREKDENKKTFLPLSLRFTYKLYTHVDDLFKDSEKRLFIFHRIEPAILFRKDLGKKIGFIHNDINKMIAKGSESIWRYAPWLYLLLEKRIMSTLDYLYVVNNDTLQFYKKTYPEIHGKMDFHPTWVDEEVFYKADQEKIKLRKKLELSLSVPINKKWLLFVGRLQQQKAPLRLIESFYEYHKIDSSSCLLIVGEGNMRNSMLERASALGVLSSVFFVGAKPQAELVKFYQASDILVLTSNFEGMPCACLEALGCGTPVVSTNVGEVNQVIHSEKTGEIANNFSPRTIAEGLYRVLQNPHMYTVNNCLNVIDNYRPLKVLTPVYEQCRKLLETIS